MRIFLKTIYLILFATMCIGATLYLPQASEIKPNHIILKHPQIVTFWGQLQQVKNIEEAYSSWAGKVEEYNTENEAELFAYKGKDARVAEAVEKYEEAKNALIEFSKDIAAVPTKEPLIATKTVSFSLLPPPTRWTLTPEELEAEHTKIEASGEALFVEIETAGQNLIKVSADVIEEERKAEEERKRKEAEAKARAANSGAGLSVAEKLRRALAGLPFNVVFTLSNTQCGIPNWNGCYTVGTGQIVIREGYVRTASICNVRRVLAHEHRHLWQDQNGLIKFDSRGQIANRDWLEADARQFERQYGC